MANVIDMTPDGTGRYTRNTAPLASLNAAVTDVGIAFERMGHLLGLYPRGTSTDDPGNRAARRQLASPRYRRAASHGADGQRALAHKAWRE